LLLLADIDLSLDVTLCGLVGTFVWDSNWCLVEQFLVPHAVLVDGAALLCGFTGAFLDQNINH